MHCRSFLAFVFVCLCPLCVRACMPAEAPVRATFWISYLGSHLREMTRWIPACEVTTLVFTESLMQLQTLSLWAFGCSCLEASAHTGCLSAREWNPTAKKAILSLFDVAWCSNCWGVSRRVTSNFVRHLPVHAVFFCYGRFPTWVNCHPIGGFAGWSSNVINPWISKMGWMIFHIHNGMWP